VSELLHVSVELIDRPASSIRQHIPEELLDELAQSIQAVGLIEPLVVERRDGRFRVIAGDRRLQALRRAGVLWADVVVRDVSEVAAEAVQVQENIVRQDMTPAEEARLFQRVYLEEGEDIEKTAGRVKLSVSYVNGRLALLAGDPLVLEALDAEDITLGVAQVLNTIVREDYRRTCLDLAIRGGATINVAKRWAAEYNTLGKIQTGERTPQTEAPAAAPYVPMAESVSCWFCEGSEDLHLLRPLHVHAGCIGALNALLKKIGRPE
jgi:ParB/RepB/Spo0J family partition protein